MSINKIILELVNYAVVNKLIEAEDRIYATNQVALLLNIINIESDEIDGSKSYSKIMEEILNYTYRNGIIENNFITTKDLFESKIMNIFIDRPSNIISRFNTLNEISSNKALEYYYNIALKSNYIKSERIAKNISFKHDTKYGEIEITINLSKPEKDPMEIAKASTSIKSTNYPKCLLCVENEGYSGHTTHPARNEHRIIPITLNYEDWYLQYSPYAYYNEHCIVLNKKHTPMKINKATFNKIIDFVTQFREYFCGSNADLPIVGGSILSHDHFQGGRHVFPMDLATSFYNFKLDQFSNTSLDVLKWPLSVIRLTSKDKKEIIEVADYVLSKWIEYNDNDNAIYSHTNSERHNTITPICRYNCHKAAYEFDLVLRNNKITYERPYGLYHPRDSVHHIKKENIGLIEVMGLAVLPGRLKTELEEISNILVNNGQLPGHLSSHSDWVTELKYKYEFDANNVQGILRKEVGEKFITCLEDAGVFKNFDSFKKFINTL